MSVKRYPKRWGRTRRRAARAADARRKPSPWVITPLQRQVLGPDQAALLIDRSKAVATAWIRGVQRISEAMVASGEAAGQAGAMMAGLVEVAGVRGEIDRIRAAPLWVSDFRLEVDGQEIMRAERMRVVSLQGMRVTPTASKVSPFEEAGVVPAQRGGLPSGEEP